MYLVFQRCQQCYIKKKKIGGYLQAQLTIIRNILYTKKTDQKIQRTYQFTSTGLFTIFHIVR